MAHTENAYVDRGAYAYESSETGGVMHPSSYLSRAGYYDGLYGVSPVMPLSSRYMTGYIEGEAIWSGLIAIARGE